MTGTTINNISSCKMVFKIDVGNIPEEEIHEHIRKIAANFKKHCDIDDDFTLKINNIDN